MMGPKKSAGGVQTKSTVFLNPLLVWVAATYSPFQSDSNVLNSDALEFDFFSKLEIGYTFCLTVLGSRNGLGQFIVFVSVDARLSNVPSG